MIKDKLVIIDGNNLLFRAYYALPLMSNFDGEFCNAVFGFANMLVKTIKEVQPKYIAVCFDGEKKNFRHEMFDGYKAQRGPTPAEMKPQFAIVKNMLDAMGITHLEGFGLEADDIIGCLSKKFDTENIILTADKDCLQLISDNTIVMQPHKGISDSVIYDKEKLREVYGIEPYQIVDLKALMGDTSDNIPGVKGVGEKTALGLLDKYTTLDNVYKHIDEISGKLHEKLVQSKDMAELSYTLATIVSNRDIPVELNDLVYKFPFNMDVLKIFKKYQFNSLLKKAEIFDTSGAVEANKPARVQVEVVKLDTYELVNEFVSQMQDCPMLAMHLTNDRISFYDQNKAYEIAFALNLIDVGLDYAECMLALKPIFEGKVRKIVFDSKSLKHTMQIFGISLNNVCFDVMLARYVLNSVGKATATFEDVIFENDLAGNSDAVNLYQVYQIYSEKMKVLKQEKLYYEIELPLVDVLFDMEIQGFKLDKEELLAQKQKYEVQIDACVQNIYEFAGRKFNINSPKQLGEILFDELGLGVKNNKKKSTNAQILEELYDVHPIVPLILKYRQISKLYNTYLDAYAQMINPKNDRIYTLFNQFNTTTGRLSSSEPNLQNIPVRTEEGKNIRKIFVPSSLNGYIVTADYSQIELRLLANFSGDEKLINAFNNGVDIHTLTASEVFGVDVSMVTPQMRRSAKAINFGIVYGISDYGLSQNISTTVAEARNYIKSYFERYPRILKYMEDNVEFCKQNGYVTTMFGRRRYIPEINSSQYVTRQFGERAAKNMPLQGSASDIIKIAMIKVHDELTKNNMRSKLILQVHDELIIDCVAEELEQVKNILRDCMQNVVDLDVKLEVNVSYGKNWFDAKD